jgi:hypothetical protein
MLMIMSGAMGLLSFSFMPARPMAEDVPLPFAILAKVVDYFPVLVLVQVVIAILMIVGGAGFLRLKQWARLILEVLAWLALLYVLGFGVFWLSCVVSMGSTAPPGLPIVFLVFMFGIGTVVIISFTIPLVMLIRVLRGSTVREALV